MLKVKMQKFKKDFSLNSYDESKIYECFVNNEILNMHQPECTYKRPEVLDFCCVGGKNDMGIDGLAIKVNGYFVTSEKEVDNLIQLNHIINIEILFIQSKYQDKIDSGEYNKFTDGVYDFLSDNHCEPHNEKIEELLHIKDYIFTDKIMQSWNSSPVVKCYYSIFGEWRDNEHINGKSQSLINKIEKLNSYEDVKFRYLGSSDLSKISDENNNSLDVVINSLGSLEFEEVAGVDNSLVILCKATEYIKILNTAEGLIRKNLFFDNVRDFQGDTEINQAMMNTVETDPASFLLLNNGITIVCSSINTGNRKVTIENPQIVNGCQTSNVLFNAQKQGIPLDNVCLMIKIIATKEDGIVNSIVEGTNSQNPIYKESFEVIRDFHKAFEQFIISIQSNEQDIGKKIYYERRSKQYSKDATVPRSRMFSFDTLAHSVVSIFLKSPYDSVLHIFKLLEKYNNRIFVESQSYLPYYTSALMLLNFENFIKCSKIDHMYDKYKYLLLYITADRLAGQPLDINNRNIDELCNKIIAVVLNDEKYKEAIDKSIKIFDDCKQLWVKKYGGKYIYAIKDNPGFTKFLTTFMYGGNVNNIVIENANPTYIGKVIKVMQDRNGKYYGFIKAKPENVFFHQEDNQNIDFSEILDARVSYKLIQNEVNGKTKAKDVTIINP